MPASPWGEMFPRTEQRDKDYYRWIGRVGGTNVKDCYGVEYCLKIGQKGGATTKALYASAHDRAMGKRGAMVRRHKG